MVTETGRVERKGKKTDEARLELDRLDADC